MKPFFLIVNYPFKQGEKQDLEHVNTITEAHGENIKLTWPRKSTASEQHDIALTLFLKQQSASGAFDSVSY